MLGFGIPKISWANLVVAAAADTSGGQNHSVGGTLDPALKNKPFEGVVNVLFMVLAFEKGDAAP